MRANRVAVATIAAVLLSSVQALAQPAPPAPPPEQPAEPTEPAQPEDLGTPPPPPPASRAVPPAREPLMPSQIPPVAEAPTTTQEPPQPAAVPPSPDIAGGDVFAEDWWKSARPVFQIHGYYRMRAELFHNFALGRFDAPAQAMWPQPADNSYAQFSGNNIDRSRSTIPLCGDDPLASPLENCENDSQASANMRFRLNPELHISDNLRINAQIDMLDNVVMGSTPGGYGNVPTDRGYLRAGRSGYTPLGAFYNTTEPPASGVNSFDDSVQVKRVWGEYLTPIGQLRFGRMPSHWGLGLLANSGDGYDSDYQTTADRIMFVTGIKAIDLYFAGAWDFPNEGATSESLNDQQGQPYDLAQLDDVSQYVLVLMRRRNPELQKLELAQGDVVVNGGVYFVYRNQVLANDEESNQGVTLGATSESVRDGYLRRGAEAYIPDLWLQLLYKKFRFELEAVMLTGSLENTEFRRRGFNYQNDDSPDDNGWKIRQYGLATQTEFKTVEDRLRLNFGFGWASGDSDVAGLTPGFSGLQPQLTPDRTISTFRFHPDYRVDLIFFRHILNRVQGAYYFRPSVDYDFTRSPDGQKLGGGAAIIWSRASEFVQAPGHQRDLGIEIDLSLYFQSKDGSLNDDESKMGGFFTMLQYGVFFPLGGLDYLPGEKDQALSQGLSLDTSTAQTLRWYAGIFF